MLFPVSLRAGPGGELNSYDTMRIPEFYPIYYLCIMKKGLHL